MLKLKTISIIAIAAMMTSTVGCGNKTDDSNEPVSPSTVAETTAAETTESETEEATTTEAATTEAATTEAATEAVTETETSSETTAEDSTDAEQTAATDISLNDIDSMFAEKIMDKDVDTVEKVLTETLNIDPATKKINDSLASVQTMIYVWELPTDLTIGGIKFNEIGITTDQDSAYAISFDMDCGEYEREKMNKIKDEISDAMKNAGYSYDADTNGYTMSYGNAYIDNFNQSPIISLSFSKSMM